MPPNKVGVARAMDKGREKSPHRRRSSITSAANASLQSFNEVREMVKEGYTKKEIKEYRQLFNMFDTDGSGAIGNEELKQAMISIGMDSNEEEIDKIIKEVDADGNGEIDFEEFCACMKKSQKIVKNTTEELIRECFDVFDQDKNGIITENEFKYIAKEVGEFDDELAEKVFRELDVSSNGHLTIDQFGAIVEDYLLSDHRPDHLIHDETATTEEDTPRAEPIVGPSHSRSSPTHHPLPPRPPLHTRSTIHTIRVIPIVDPPQYHRGGLPQRADHRAGQGGLPHNHTGNNVPLPQRNESREDEEEKVEVVVSQNVIAI